MASDRRKSGKGNASDPSQKWLWIQEGKRNEIYLFSTLLNLNSIHWTTSGILYAIYILKLLWKKTEGDETRLKKKSVEGMSKLMKI